MARNVLRRFSLIAMGLEGTNNSRSAINTNREALGDFGPAFVISDLKVPPQIEAGERLVDLQTSERKKRYGSTSSRYRRNVWS